MPGRRPRIRGVLFDLGGTLVDERDFDGWCEVARRFLLDLDPDALTHAFFEVEAEFDAGPPPSDRTVGPVEFWRRVLGRAAAREVSTDLSAKFCEAVRSTDRPIGLFSDTRRCLDRLASEHRQLGVISNSTSEARVRQILDRVGILDYFSRVVSSGTEGVSKPDPEIFRRALSRMHLLPEEALYVGNLRHTDAEAARAVGLHALWLNRYGFGYEEDPPEITSLLEVPLWVQWIERGEKGPRAEEPRDRS